LVVGKVGIAHSTRVIASIIKESFMSYPRYLWLNTSPSLRCFEQPLLCYLSKRVSIARWEYLQTQDEASSLDIAIALLHDYLKNIPDTVHLIGHSTSGLLGLLYARQYPE
jgi:pimeloyl-ACP methyl ester carboxylesterase